jgi:hypothetical protein
MCTKLESHMRSRLSFIRLLAQTSHWCVVAFDSLFGTRSKKQRKSDQIASNRRQGVAAEDESMFEDRIQGYEVERTGRGHDYVRRKRDLLTGKVTKTQYVEVKSGNAKLSKLQKKTKRKKSNYVIKRKDPLLFW